MCKAWCPNGQLSWSLDYEVLVFCLLVRQSTSFHPGAGTGQDRHVLNVHFVNKGLIMSEISPFSYLRNHFKFFFLIIFFIIFIYFIIHFEGPVSDMLCFILGYRQVSVVTHVVKEISVVNASNV